MLYDFRSTSGVDFYLFGPLGQHAIHKPTYAAQRSIQQLAPLAAPPRSIPLDILRCFRYFTPTSSFILQDQIFNATFLIFVMGPTAAEVGAYKCRILVRMGRSVGRPVRTEVYTNWRQATAHQAHRLHPLQVHSFRRAPSSLFSLPTRPQLQTRRYHLYFLSIQTRSPQ
jgi:hypothetical protein